MLNLNQQQRKRRSGFTLIEILLVVVIIGILAAVVTPRLGGHTKRANISAAKGNIAALGLAIDTYEVHNGYLPPTLNALVVKSNEDNWLGPYVKRIPLDPWKRPFIYTVKGNQYDLICVGPDGAQGGSDDITN